MYNNILGVGILIICVYFLSTPNWGTQKHTSYSMSCNTFGVSLADCETGFSVMKSMYLAIPEAQTIISKNMLWKHDDCVVFDAENWRCGDISMRDGWFLDVGGDVTRPKYRTITRIEYTVRSTIHFFMNLFVD
jgi:hypothetical protein